MKRLQLFEDYYFGKKASHFPQRKHSRGVKFIRRLFPGGDKFDLEEISEKIAEWVEAQKNGKKGIYSDYSVFLDDSGKVDPQKVINFFNRDQAEAVVVTRPDGLEDIVIIDELEITEPREGLGFLSGVTNDEKYVFSFPVDVGGSEYAGYEIVDIDFGDIEWDYYS